MNVNFAQIWLKKKPPQLTAPSFRADVCLRPRNGQLPTGRPLGDPHYSITLPSPRDERKATQCESAKQSYSSSPLPPFGPLLVIWAVGEVTGEIVTNSGGAIDFLWRQFLHEQVLADDHNSAVHVSNHDQSCGAALAVEEEYVLRCLGAALIMQWNTLPTTLQREVFDTAGSMGKLLETAALVDRSLGFCTSTRMITVATNWFQRKARIAKRDCPLWLCPGGTMREARSVTDCRCEY